MSQDAPVPILDDDEPDNPMAQILLRENSRATIPTLRAGGLSSSASAALPSTNSTANNHGYHSGVIQPAAAEAVTAAVHPSSVSPPPPQQPQPQQQQPRQQTVQQQPQQSSIPVAAREVVSRASPPPPGIQQQVITPTAHAPTGTGGAGLTPQQHALALERAQLLQQHAHLKQMTPEQQRQHQARVMQHKQAMQQLASVRVPSQTAVWNCVNFHLQHYQSSIIKDLPMMIAAAHAKVDPRAHIGGEAAILLRLESAIKRMNSRVTDVRRDKKKVTYDTTIMTKMIQTQDKIIFEELTLKLGLNLSSLERFINIVAELRKRADAAHEAVKSKVDRAKRAEGHRLAAPTSGGSNGSSSGAGGGRGNVSVAVGGTKPSSSVSPMQASSSDSAAGARGGAVAVSGGVTNAATAAAATVAGALPVKTDISMVSPAPNNSRAPASPALAAAVPSSMSNGHNDVAVKIEKIEAAGRQQPRQHQATTTLQRAGLPPSSPVVASPAAPASTSPILAGTSAAASPLPRPMASRSPPPPSVSAAVSPAVAAATAAVAPVTVAAATAPVTAVPTPAPALAPAPAPTQAVPAATPGASIATGTMPTSAAYAPSGPSASGGAPSTVYTTVSAIGAPSSQPLPAVGAPTTATAVPGVNSSNATAAATQYLNLAQQPPVVATAPPPTAAPAPVPAPASTPAAATTASATATPVSQPIKQPLTTATTSAKPATTSYSPITAIVNGTTSNQQQLQQQKPAPLSEPAGTTTKPLSTPTPKSTPAKPTSTSASTTKTGSGAGGASSSANTATIAGSGKSAGKSSGSGGSGKSASSASKSSAASSNSKPKVHHDEDKHGLQKLPPDKLETAKTEVELVSDVGILREEEERLRDAPALAAADKEMALQQTWFANNVVSHRHAWCCLRDAGERAGMRRVLQQRPWGNPKDPLGGGKLAAENDVLKLMSLATQHYLKDMLHSLKIIAWQRRGGLNADLLSGLESRLEKAGKPAEEGSEAATKRLSPDAELRRGLVPKLASSTEHPRVSLRREEMAHRAECQAREVRWEVEMADKLSTAEEVRKRLIRRGHKKLPPGSFKWWEDMETTAKSGWLSREQMAASEFARRVAVKHGIGVVASGMKKKEEQANKEQQANAVRPPNKDKADAVEDEVAIPNDRLNDDPLDLAGGGEDPPASGLGAGSVNSSNTKKRPHDSAFVADDGPGSSSKKPRGSGSNGDGNVGNIVNKRPRDDGESEEGQENIALEGVRNTRRRLALAPPPPAPADGGGTSASTRGIYPAAGGGYKAADGTGGGDKRGTGVDSKSSRKLEISNADLAELLRSTKPRGNPRAWASVLYRAQNKLKGAHAGGVRGGAGDRAVGRRAAVRP